MRVVVRFILHRKVIRGTNLGQSRCTMFGGQIMYKATSFLNNFSDNIDAEADAFVFIIQSLVFEFPIFDFRNRITISSPYQEQLSLIREVLRKCGLSGGIKKTIELSTVDPVQGKENDIIFVGKVRSGRDSPGFIEDRLRVNVALSRARNSLIVVGDTQLLERKVLVWKSVLDEHKEIESIKYHC